MDDWQDIIENGDVDDLCSYLNHNVLLKLLLNKDPIQHALRYDRLDMVKTLNKYRFHIQNNNYETFKIVICQSHITTIRYCINNIDLQTLKDDVVGDIIREAIKRSARDNDCNVLNLIFDQLPNIDVNNYNVVTSSLLTTAIDCRSLIVANRLLEMGSDLNYHTCHSTTILMFCVLRNTYDIAQLCIEYGSDVNYMVHDLPVLLCAVRHLRSDFVKLFVENGAQLKIEYFMYEDRLYNASKCESGLDIIIYLLQHDVIEQKLISRLLFEILVRARRSKRELSYKHIDIITMLLQKGANVNYVRNDGQHSSFQISICDGYYEILQLMYELGHPKPNVHADFQNTTIIKVLNKSGCKYKNKEQILSYLNNKIMFNTIKHISK